MNRCDVSGRRTRCGGNDCEHFVPFEDDDNCCHKFSEYCISTDAIRAAIEAERVDGAIKKMPACQHKNRFTLDLCDGKGAMAKCIDCGRVVIEP